MKEYKIKLSEEVSLTASDGDKVSELGICLQVWQDLNKINSEATEDLLIKNILEQILEKEFNGKKNIPFPDYYKKL